MAAYTCLKAGQWHLTQLFNRSRHIFANWPKAWAFCKSLFCRWQCSVSELPTTSLLPVTSPVRQSLCTIFPLNFTRSTLPECQSPMSFLDGGGCVTEIPSWGNCWSRKKKNPWKIFWAKGEMETSPHFPLPSFSLKPMISSPGPTKVVIIIASGREPVTHHYSKVESHPVSQISAA